MRQLLIIYWYYHQTDIICNLEEMQLPMIHQVSMTSVQEQAANDVYFEQMSHFLDNSLNISTTLFLIN
jgi:hypothetical protein